ncbi:MAG: hypothetical protein Q8N23_13855 [Archangium sp.]|nr:hypothetical protein [Archangium sp.]MDP3153758.1 hypothetical protein [Archangium sp.]MDP3575683.1 hypothetical protein [Archangium sp.]
MLDDTRLDGKLLELSRELMVRSLVPGFGIADAFTMKGIDEAGRPGLFAAVLLAPGKIAELETLTTFRQLLTQRLKQLDTRTPAWPIVVQAAPEVIDAQNVVPGGREYFQQVKTELVARTARMKQRVSVSQMPVVRLAPEAKASKPMVKAAPAATAKRPAAPARKATTAARRSAPARSSARTARARR